MPLPEVPMLSGVSYMADTPHPIHRTGSPPSRGESGEDGRPQPAGRRVKYRFISERHLTN